MADKHNLVNRTKIVCTIGPASADESILRKMMRAGMDVVRINFSYGSADDNLELLGRVRAAASAEGRSVAILQDLQGAKLRVGELPEGGIELITDSTVTLRAGAARAEDDVIPVSYQHLHKEVKHLDRILLNDGLIELEVLNVSGRRIVAKVLLGGTLMTKNGLAVPTARLSLDSLTNKDKEDLSLGLQHGVDFVALSFVRTADDVRQLRQKITELLPADTEPPAIIVKIEKHEAIDNFAAILQETDGVMIARGDLGLETEVSSVPITQKELIAQCVVAGKPVITATQMLASMTQRPRPTRAEVSDVANAVLDHTDAVMLSGETAIGSYPVRAVQTMAKIIASTEASSLDILRSHPEATGEPVAWAAASAAVVLARHIDAAAIVVTTQSGYSARALARFRSATPIFAVAANPRVQRQLVLSWGIEPLYIEGYERSEEVLQQALQQLVDSYGVVAGSNVVVVSGLKRERGGYDSAIRVAELLEPVTSN